MSVKVSDPKELEIFIEDLKTRIENLESSGGMAWVKPLF